MAPVATETLHDLCFSGFQFLPSLKAICSRTEWKELGEDRHSIKMMSTMERASEEWRRRRRFWDCRTSVRHRRRGVRWNTKRASRGRRDGTRTRSVWADLDIAGAALNRLIAIAPRHSRRRYGLPLRMF